MLLSQNAPTAYETSTFTEISKYCSSNNNLKVYGIIFFHFKYLR